MFSLLLSIQRLLDLIYSLETYLFSNKIKKNISNLVYFDLETTGLNPYHDKIIEYSFIKEIIENSNKPFNYIHSLINPEVKFEQKITQITGIHPEELYKQPKIDQTLPDIIDFINNNANDVYLVAHNCDCFDRLFILNNIKNFNNIYPNKKIDYRNIKFLDTLHLSKKVLPNLKNYSLKKLAKHFGIEEGKHRALSDTICLREIYLKLIELTAIELDISKEYLLKNPKLVSDFIY